MHFTIKCSFINKHIYLADDFARSDLKSLRQVALRAHTRMILNRIEYKKSQLSFSTFLLRCLVFRRIPAGNTEVVGRILNDDL